MATKAEKILKSAEQRLASVQFELGRIKAALWLVDQIEVGEFYYLSNRGAHGRPPCWLSHLGGMTNTDLHGHLFHMAMREIADARGVEYISLQQALCGPESCTELAAPGIPLQFDHGHLTSDGSVVVAERLRKLSLLPEALVTIDEILRSDR